MVDVRQFSYGAAGIAVIGALGSFIQSGTIFGLIGAVVAGLGAAAAVAIYKYGYFIFPLLTQGSRIVQIMKDGYEIPPEQDVVTKKAGGTYYASQFLGVKIYESASEKTPEQNVVFTEYFERAISGIRYVTKVSMLLYVKDMTEFREEIETKRAEAQLRLARERDKPEPDVLKMDRYAKEVAMWDTQLDKLTSGIMPMGVSAYIMTTAAGVSAEAAMAMARAQGKELRSTIANALNVEVDVLKGEEMLRCFDWEHALPVTPAELERSVL